MLHRHYRTRAPQEIARRLVAGKQLWFISFVVDEEARKPFACDECGKRITGKAGLLLHKLTHLREFYRQFINKNLSTNEKCCKTQPTMIHARSRTNAISAGENSWINMRSPHIEKLRIAVSSLYFFTDRLENANNLRKRSEWGDQEAIQVREVWEGFPSWGLLAGAHEDTTWWNWIPIIADKISISGDVTVARPHACDQCDMRFSTKFFLREHKISHLRKFLSIYLPFPPNIFRSAENDPLKKTFDCDVCGNRMANSQSLRKHKLTHLGKLSNFSITHCTIRKAKLRG